MKSIFSDFKGLHKDGKPLDLLAMWRKAFDKASEKEVALFEKTYSDSWFTYATPQMSLTAEGIMGKYNLRFMATLIGNESPTPLRRSDGFDIWSKEIPRVGHKFAMEARDYRKIMEVYKNPFLKEADKVKQIEKTFKNDMQNAYLGCKDVMDFISLMAFSNFGVAQFTPSINNPGGRSFEIDYLMDAQNKLISAFNWTTANTNAGKVKPVLMLAQICTDLRNRGIVPGEICMSQDLYYWMRMDPSTRLLVHGTDKKDQVVTTSQFSELLTGNEIPPITVITKKMGIDKDGKRSSIEPWNHNFICIKPAGVIGEIQPAIEDSELMEEDNVEYMNAGNGIRIAKWRTGESTGQVAAEYTQGSGRLLPIISDINAIVCLQVRGITEKTLTADATTGVAPTYVTKDVFENNALVEA